MKKKAEPPENLERWMVSYADFMTLLFALFVVLYAFAMAKQSDAKSMIESIAQAFTESVAINSPGGALLVPGSMSTQLAQDIQEAVKNQMQAQNDDVTKKVLQDGGVMMNFQSTTTVSNQEREDSSSGSDSDKEYMNSADSISSSGDLVISENTFSKNNNPKSTDPNGGNQSGDGGFQAGGSSDRAEIGGKTDVQADTQGEGTNGAHFDAVRRSISEAISDTGMEKYIEIEEDPHWLSININSGLVFAEGSASVLAPSKPVIQRIAVAIANINNYIRIRGYTDDTFVPNGIFKNSWDLSAQRGVSVLGELQSNGINPARMAVEAYGEYSPSYSNSTAAGRALNRRVVIAISRFAIASKPSTYVDGDVNSQNNSSSSTSKAGNSNVDVVRGDNNSIELNFSRQQ